MPVLQRQVQLGKKGLNENFIRTLKHHFDTREMVRISVLKSARKNRESVKKYSDEIVEKLGNHYTTKIIGFTIVVKKWRREMRQKTLTTSRLPLNL